MKTSSTIATAAPATFRQVALTAASPRPARDRLRIILTIRCDVLPSPYGFLRAIIAL